jgi:hypothetical protein
MRIPSLRISPAVRRTFSAAGFFVFWLAALSIASSGRPNGKKTLQAAMNFLENVADSFRYRDRPVENSDNLLQL